MSNRELIDQIRAELAKAEARPGLAKGGKSARDRHRCRVHAAFCEAIDALELDGWSRRQIAQHMEVDPVTLKDWYEAGNTQRSQLPAWIKSALPLQARVVMTRHELSWSETPPPSRTGTDG